MCFLVLFYYYVKHIFNIFLGWYIYFTMTIKTSFDSNRIEILNGFNFQSWKRHIKYLLTHERNLYTLSTTKPVPIDKNDNEGIKAKVNWEVDDSLAKASMLHHMKDNIIPLFEDKETAKELMEALEAKYGPRFDTHVQLLLDKFNGTRMNEGDYIGDHINTMDFLAKELANADNPVLNKMQVTTILNILLSSWDHIVTTLTHSGKEVTMISLPVLLVLEEERMKRRKSKNQNHNLLMTQTIPKSKPPKRQWKNTSIPYKKRKFQKRWPKKQINNGRLKNVCYHCGRFGHIRKNFPNYNNNNNNKNNGTKQIIMTISEAMIIEPLLDNWWSTKPRLNTKQEVKNCLLI